MYADHPEILSPPDDAVVWRYVDIPRLLHLLCERKLHLTRIDGFDDGWEGTWPTSVVAAIRSNWPKQNQEYLLSTTEKARRSFFVSCWHESAVESAALWSAYSGVAGVAIQSTVCRVKQAVSDAKQYYIGRIRYIDFSQEPVTPLNMFVPPFLKRRSFEHEREVRLLHWGLPTNDQVVQWDQSAPFHQLEIDPNALIQRVFVSPTSQEWICHIVETLCRRFGVEAPVQRSTLFDPRVY